MAGGGGESYLNVVFRTNCKGFASSKQLRNNSNFVLSDHVISSLNKRQCIYDPFNFLTYFHLLKKDR